MFDFMKREAVLCITLAAALVSACFVPPSGAYLAYIDFRVLALLLCLMLTVAGARQAGVFELATSRLLQNVRDTRALAMVLVGLSFFSAMLITNDVALITLVPLALLTLRAEGTTLIPTVIGMTIAANLGSMATPIGNPQNLFLYAAFQMTPRSFFKTMLLPSAFSAIILAVYCLTIRRKRIDGVPAKTGGSCRTLLPWSALFLVCIACVARVLDYRIMLAIVILAVLLLDRRLLAQADYSLLFTFVGFFIFVGNLKQLPQIRSVLEQTVAGKELLAGIAFSQIISNVPAAVLLSGFCQDPLELLVGVNLGGLGTPIASMASLISYKQYTAAPDAKPGRYMVRFLIVNYGVLALLWLLCTVIRHETGSM